MEAGLIEQGWMLIQRLERISVDSLWARRASGQRGALLKLLELYNGDPTSQMDSELTPSDAEKLKHLIQSGYRLLEKSAREYTRGRQRN